MASMTEATARRALLLALALAGCSTDTAGLARGAAEPPPVGGAGSSAPPPGSGGEGTGGAGGSDVLPSPGQPGVGALEVVHGLVDGGQLFVCLWDVESGRALGVDSPEPLGGVAYGQSTSVPSSWDLSRSVDVELFVAAGEAAAEPSCSGLREVAMEGEGSGPAVEAAPIDAGLELPPFPLEPLAPRRAGSLRLLPGVIQPGAHYALVAAGCTNPAGSPNDAICGPPDSLFSSQQTIVLAEIAAEVAGAGAGLQFLNASRAVERADLVLQGQSQRQSLRLTTNVQFGAVRPRNAAPVEEPVGIELHVQGATQSSYTQAWSDTLPAIGSDSLATGQNYLLVYVGPAPGSFAEGVSPPRFVLLRGD
jgi:hypothetical protein